MRLQKREHGCICDSKGEQTDCVSLLSASKVVESVLAFSQQHLSYSELHCFGNRL